MTQTLTLDCRLVESFPLITPFIDGESLVDLITEFERQKGFDDPAGGYGGFVPERHFGPVDRYFFGKSEPVDGDEVGEIYLLGCECGIMGCWPLVGHVVIADGQVSWERFSQPHRTTRDYSDFGPFAFDRSQYEIEVAKARVFCA